MENMVDFTITPPGDKESVILRLKMYMEQLSRLAAKAEEEPLGISVPTGLPSLTISGNVEVGFNFKDDEKKE